MHGGESVLSSSTIIFKETLKILNKAVEPNLSIVQKSEIRIAN